MEGPPEGPGLPGFLGTSVHLGEAGAGPLSAGVRVTVPTSLCSRHAPPGDLLWVRGMSVGLS